MITLGIDIGTGTTKGVLMEDGSKILAKDLDVVKGRPNIVATRMMENLLTEAKII